MSNSEHFLNKSVNKCRSVQMSYWTSRCRTEASASDSLVRKEDNSSYKEF
jgi:hypothetical protein